MKIGYARVSTKDQTVDLQLDALKQAGCERIYQEVASGAKTARPELVRIPAIPDTDTVLIRTVFSFCFLCSYFYFNCPVCSSFLIDSPLNSIR